MPPKKGKGGKRKDAGRNCKGGEQSREAPWEQKNEYFRSQKAEERDQETVPKVRIN